MKLIQNKNKLSQIFFTIITSILTVIIPFLYFLSFLLNGALPNIEPFNIIIVSISSIFIGIFISLFRYLVYSYPKHSFRRITLNLISSVLMVIIIALPLPFSTLYLQEENSGFYLDLSNVFILLIILGSLFPIRNLYDLVESTLFKFRNTKSKRYKLIKKTLINCPQCGYACQFKWKLCPICKSQLRAK